MEAKKKWSDLANVPGESGRGDCQIFWHEFAAELFRSYKILDVGAGLAFSASRFQMRALKFVTQDVGPGLPVDLRTPVQEIKTDSFEVVTAFDVIEHIENDVEFLHHLLRIATNYVFITTPNYKISKAANPHHVREYTPAEFVTFILGNTNNNVTPVWYDGHSNGRKKRTLPVQDFIESEAPHLAVLLCKNTTLPL